jgi:hypothetical protein
MPIPGVSKSLTRSETARSIKFAEKALARTLNAAAESRGLDVVTVAHSMGRPRNDLADQRMADSPEMINDLRKRACQTDDTIGPCAGNA